VVRNPQSDDLWWDRRPDGDAGHHAPAPQPTPAEVYFEVGLHLAAALSIALAGNLLAVAAGG